MQTFQEIFTEYGGDYGTTMERFMGSESMYVRLMDMLFQDRSMASLDEALQNADLKAAFEAAHTLKGVVANMGLTPLLDQVCRIVEPLRITEERDDYGELYQGIREEFQKVEVLREKLKKAVE